MTEWTDVDIDALTPSFPGEWLPTVAPVSETWLPTKYGDVHVVRPSTAPLRGVVLLLHGDGRASSWRHWSPVIDALAHAEASPSVTALADAIVMVDAPGYGDSTGRRRAYRSDSVGVIDAVFAALATAAGVAAFDFVLVCGRSVGGRAALEYAAARPHAVDGLVVSHPVAATASELARVRAPTIITWARDDSGRHEYSGHKGARYVARALGSHARLVSWRESEVAPLAFYSRPYLRLLTAHLRRVAGLSESPAIGQGA